MLMHNVCRIWLSAVATTCARGASSVRLSSLPCLPARPSRSLCATSNEQSYMESKFDAFCDQVEQTVSAESFKSLRKSYLGLRSDVCRELEHKERQLQDKERLVQELKGRERQVVQALEGRVRDKEGRLLDKDRLVRDKERLVRDKERLIQATQRLRILSLTSMAKDSNQTQQRVLLEQFEKLMGFNVQKLGRKNGWAKFLNSEEKEDTPRWRALQICHPADVKTFATEAANLADAVNTQVHSIQFQTNEDHEYVLMVNAHSEVARCLMVMVAAEVAPGAKIETFDGGAKIAAYVKEDLHAAEQALL